ncbi:putative holin-like toxin [Virgibacillus alimentarius]|uniref:putative holin-like toxin n=1 Tax=Virgibacillus alimentarius TaxID=698769 RepID=UPI0009FC04F5|nr:MULTISPECIES: putative holin-like toxin [Virgibacillus]HLR69753.1 putative holin-like toxin [Virgibacillus sp.]
MIIDKVLFRLGSANPACKGVKPISVYEALMVMVSFGTLLIALVALVVTLINKK